MARRRSTITGDKATIANLRRLATLIAPAANEASKRALEPTLAAAKENVTERSGLLRRSLILRRLRDSAKTRPVYVVGVAPKSKARRYAHVVEFGRAANASGKGAMPAQRPLTRAYDATREGAVVIFNRIFGPAIEKSAARIAARNAKRAAKT